VNLVHAYFFGDDTKIDKNQWPVFNLWWLKILNNADAVILPVFNI
jgi:hypothetical protein